MNDQSQNKTLSQKAVSLPRLKATLSDRQKQVSPRKMNKDIHKVKWSMAPKCLLQGHDGKDILYVCINSQCEEPSRLVCETCFFKNHQKHNEEFLAVDEIKSGSIEKLRYWPFQPKYRKIFEFVTKHQSYINNMIQDVNATFHGMAVRIISSIDKIRLSLLKKIDNFYIRQSVKKDFCQKIKEQLEKCFELKKIQETVKGVFNKEIKHEVFLTKMKDLLNDQDLHRNREILNDYFAKAEKGKDMFFDKMYFLKKENWIIEQIQQQQKTLRETEVTVDQADIGVQKILPQTLAYLDRCAQGHYPLTFEKKILQDGSQYTGFYEKGTRTMFGMRKYKTGFNYYGEWRINAKNGWGVYENKSSGYRYAGSWKEDKKNGYGREQTLTSVYEGNFLGDKKDGFGIFTEDDIRFEITWKNDKKHGAGKRIQKNGIQVEVYYINGIQSTGKSGKVGQSYNLRDLTKRFGAKSIAQQTRST